MEELLRNIDWEQLIGGIWAALLLPILTYIGTQLGGYAKAKRVSQYTDILLKHVQNAVKDVHETTVKDLKGTSGWTKETQDEAKALAKEKAMQALDASAYQMLSSANRDFEDHLDGLIETALYNLKNEKRPKT